MRRLFVGAGEHRARNRGATETCQFGPAKAFTASHDANRINVMNPCG
jgi:hypothetical protein